VTGLEIRKRRIRLGLSRDQLAHRLGVSAATVEEWEGEGSAISCPMALSQILREEESEHAGEIRAAFGDPGFDSPRLKLAFHK
jgi:DNA-binding transcriptional regulator YiaG